MHKGGDRQPTVQRDKEIKQTNEGKTSVKDPMSEKFISTVSVTNPADHFEEKHPHIYRCSSFD